MKISKLVFAALLLLTSAPLALGQAGGTYTTIDFPGADWTAATGIDTAGDIVGFFGDTSGRVHGFLSSNGVFTQHDAPGANETTAYGINDVGQIVGGTGTFGGLFVYDIQTQSYILYPYHNLVIVATGINNSGIVVGWATSSSGVGLELDLTTGRFTQVRIPGARSTQLTGINNSGAVVGLATSPSGVNTSWLIQGGGTFKQIVVPGVPSALAMGINDSNVLAGDYASAGRNSAFEWARKSLFKPINEPNQPNTYAAGINNAGQVVGEYWDINSAQGHGFLWTPPAPVEKK